MKVRHPISRPLWQALLRSVLHGLSALTLLAWGVSVAAATATSSDEFRLASPDANPEISTVYRGTLGDEQVQMTLTPDPDDQEILKGEYFIFGGGLNILLAGEISKDTFYLEESQDGTTISGYWEGHLEVEKELGKPRGFIVGTWSNTDETLKKPFRLERVLRTRALIKRVS